MEEITVVAGQRARLMVRLAQPDFPDGSPDDSVPEGLHGDILFKNATGEGTFTVVGGPASVLEHGDREVVLMLNGTAEGGVGRYTIERIQLKLPHRAPTLVPKDDPLFSSFCVNVTGPQYPRVVEIKPRPADIAWAEEVETPPPA